MRCSPHLLELRLPSALGLLLALSLTPCASLGQAPPSGQGTRSAVGPSLQPVTVVISVRDKNGGPVDNPAIVRFFSNFSSFNVTTTTREGASVTFPNVLEGEYEVEVRCAGYKEAVEHISVVGVGSVQPVYLYMAPESEVGASVLFCGPPRMAPKLPAEIDKGIELMRKNDIEGARIHFRKAAELAPSNPDVLYYLATSEIALNQKDQAKKTLEKAISLAPTHEKALLALGRLQLESSETASAEKTLEQAYAAHGASWKTHLLLATA